ncbi:MAG: lytic murein transglycosylase [Deltaproteobacteria bacterium]|nr:lytic murein transglycosylase [Deltaproteobacteria bacterium]
MKLVIEQIVFIFLLSSFWAAGVGAEPPTSWEKTPANLPVATMASEFNTRRQAINLDDAQLKGWNIFAKRLAQEGVSEETLKDIFLHKKMSQYEPLVFNARPTEKHIPYRKRNSLRERTNALTFYHEHRRSFIAAEKEYQVPVAVILAILQIETQCGKFTGEDSIFYRLARLASSGDAESIKESYPFNLKKHPGITLSEVKKRALYLEGEFLPHVLATIKYANQQNQNPMDVKGSYGGAMGLPQFLPGHYFTYGVDGDNDGKVDLLNPPDAVFSVANYLKYFGWTGVNMSTTAKRNVIWNYNHSADYVSTVLAMASNLDKELKSPPAIKVSKPKKISRGDTKPQKIKNRHHLP